MSRAGSSFEDAGGEAGFTLFEMLVVMIVVTVAIGSVSSLYRSPSSGTEVRAAALIAASRLRDLRVAAMSTGSERVATIDAERRTIRFGDGREPLALNRSIAIAVTAADSERRTTTTKTTPTVTKTAGVRFFPNGSSSGGTIRMSMERQAYEIRVNWLTGRVSTSALN